MKQPDPDVVDDVLSLTLAVAAGDDEAVEVLLRSHDDPADIAIAGSYVIWRMATALGQMVEPTRSAPQMIHVFAQALREPADEGGMSG